MRRLFSAVFAVLILGGCAVREEPRPLCRVVTKVEVAAFQNGETLKKVYTQPKKIDVILYYLRSVESRVPASIHSETFRADTYEITLTLSDGSQAQYFQLYDQYLRHGQESWKKINALRGSMLHPLITSMPSD